MKVERCLRCDGSLEKGFMIDRGDYHVKEQAQWASGEPNASFWRSSAVKSGEKTMEVVTYRCSACGRLESFAHPKA